LSIHYDIVSEPWKGSSCEIRRGSVARPGNIRFTRQVGAAGAASKRNYLKFQCNRKHWLAGDRNRTSEEHTGTYGERWNRDNFGSRTAKHRG